MSHPVRQDYTPPELRPEALVSVGTADEISIDVLIIGSGMGGSSLAWALKESGLDVLVAERGRFLPREPENSQPAEMYIKGRHKNAGYWYDGSTGKPFAPGVYYWVGGNTRFYGAMLPRFRRSDFTEVEHHEGVSRAWPFGYDDLEPFYIVMEELLQVRGTTWSGASPSAASTPTRRPSTAPWTCCARPPGRSSWSAAVRSRPRRPTRSSRSPSGGRSRSSPRGTARAPSPRTTSCSPAASARPAR